MQYCSFPLFSCLLLFSFLSQLVVHKLILSMVVLMEELKIGQVGLLVLIIFHLKHVLVVFQMLNLKQQQ